MPIAMGNYDKFLAKVKQDAELNAPAIVLPRMSYEMTGINYDASRKMGNSGYRNKTNFRYTPVPYKIDFTLYIMTKYAEDGNKIVEQIMPFFRPDWTPTVQFFEDDPTYLLDVPVFINSATMEDDYKETFDNRRTILWTLTFSMHAKFFGPTVEKKLIKFVKVNTYANMPDSADKDHPDSILTVQPGMDENGNPTTDINSTIPYQQIDIDDDWDYIVQISDKGDSP